MYVSGLTQVAFPPDYALMNGNHGARYFEVICQLELNRPVLVITNTVFLFCQLYSQSSVEKDLTYPLHSKVCV